MEAGGFVPEAAGEAEEEVHGVFGFANEPAEGVVDAVVFDLRLVGDGVVAGDVENGPQVIGQRPENLTGGRRSDHFVS